MSKRWNRLSALTLHLAVVQRVVVRDPLVQALMLSAYCADAVAAGGVDREPFHVYHWFTQRFSGLLPEPWAGPFFSFREQSAFVARFGRARSLRGCARYRIATLLRTGQAAPSVLTLAFCALLHALGNHQRLCCAVPGESKLQRQPTHDDRQRLLQVQLQSNTSPLRLTLPNPTIPLVYWCEVFWPLVDAWSAVEFYSGRFNVASECFTDRSGQLQPAEFRPKYLQAHAALIADRIPRELLPERTEDYSKKTLSAYADLFLDDDSSAEGASSDDAGLGEEDVRKSPAARPETPSGPPELAAKKARLGGSVYDLWQPVRRQQRADAELQAMQMAEAGLSAWLNPWERDKVSGKRPFSGHVGAVAVSPFGQIMDVTARYFECYKCTPKLTREMNVAVASNSSLFVGGGSDSLAAQHLYELDALKMEDFKASGDSAPTSLAQFRASRAYTLRSLLKPNEFLREGAAPKGLFKSEPFYSRSDVVKLYTARELEKMSRSVLPGAVPIRESAAGLPLYSLAESCIITEEAAAERESHVWVVKGHSSVPPGFTHLKETVFPSVTYTATKLELRFFHALVGYKYEARRLKPLYNGVIVRETEVAALLERQQYFHKLKLRKRAFEEEQRIVGVWRAVCKMLVAFER